MSNSAAREHEIAISAQRVTSEMAAQGYVRLFNQAEVRLKNAGFEITWCGAGDRAPIPFVPRELAAMYDQFWLVTSSDYCAWLLSLVAHYVKTDLRRAEEFEVLCRLAGPDAVVAYVRELEQK